MLDKKIAERLLKIEAVVLSTSEPFTWSSGLKSPIYCDNRLTMAYPEIRDEIASGFVQLIKENFGDVQVVAGTATAGIPHAAWVSQKLELPMAYVRSSAKSHGKQKQIEGLVAKGDKVVVIEDLISTGASSLTAVEALREAGAEVLGVAAIFTYGLPQASVAFGKEGIKSVTLTNFETLMNTALEKNLITDSEVEQLKVWHRNPQGTEWLVG